MVLIKEMEMPECCGTCGFRCKTHIVGRHNACFMKPLIIERLGEIHPQCPLAEVEQYGPEGTLYKEK